MKKMLLILALSTLASSFAYAKEFPSFNCSVAQKVSGYSKFNLHLEMVNEDKINAQLMEFDGGPLYFIHNKNGITLERSAKDVSLFVGGERSEVSPKMLHIVNFNVKKLTGTIFANLENSSSSQKFKLVKCSVAIKSNRR